MFNFANMGVFARIMLSFSIVVAMACGMGVFSIYELARVGDTTVEIKDNWLPSVRTSMEMRRSLTEFRIGELQHVLSTTDEDMTHYEKRMESALSAFHKAEVLYEKVINTAEERVLHNDVKLLMQLYLSMHDKIIVFSRKNETEEAMKLARADSAKLRAEIDDKLAKIVDVNVNGSDVAGEEAGKIYDNARTMVSSILALSAGISVILAYFFARKLIRQLGGEPTYAVEVASEIAAGNLAVDVQLKKGDTSSMLHAMDQMRHTLANIVRDIKTSSESVAVASGQIAQGNAELSQRTEEQASSLEETAASMEELTATVKQNSDNARQANQLAVNASEIAERGGKVVGQVVDTMRDIADSSGKVSDIIAVIEGIAFQTNILALNAAVEAARAGNQGRGFAVVAGEVRALAQRSAAAAKDVKDLIEGSIGKVDAGSELVEQAGSIMQEIELAVTRVTDIMGEISAASLEQTGGIEQVNAAVTEIDKVTQQNAALVEEAAAAAASLDEQSEQLRAAVAVFRLTREGRKAAAYSPVMATA